MNSSRTASHRLEMALRYLKEMFWDIVSQIVNLLALYEQIHFSFWLKAELRHLNIQRSSCEVSFALHTLP